MGNRNAIPISNESDTVVGSNPTTLKSGGDVLIDRCRSVIGRRPESTGHSLSNSPGSTTRRRLTSGSSGGHRKASETQSPVSFRTASISHRRVSVSSGAIDRASFSARGMSLVGDEPILTVHQRSLIQKSWRKSSHDGLGCKILMRVFEMSPAVPKLFQLDGITPAQLRYNARFVAHARVFVKALDTVVSNVNDLPAVEEYLRKLGKAHAHFHSRGFRPAYWDFFAEAMTECAIDWEGGKRCKEVMKAWRVVVSYVIEMMRDGFKSALKEERYQQPDADAAASCSSSLAVEPS